MQYDDSRRTADEYNAMAEEYDAHNARSGANQFYERPATQQLIGNPTGLHVLEVGCGSGRLTAWLVDGGAHVTACDVSERLLEIAERRVGDRAEFHVTDIVQPLSFIPNNSIDLIVASLVMHYIRDWTVPLSEFHRILRPTGAVVMSIHHPSWDWRNHCPDDYFAFIQVSEVWVKPHPVTFWRRPLGMVTEAIADAGFVIERAVEARPQPELETIDTAAFQQLMRVPFLLHLRLRPVQVDGSVAAIR